MIGCKKIYKTLIHRIFGVKSPSLMISICPYLADEYAAYARRIRKALGVKR